MELHGSAEKVHLGQAGHIGGEGLLGAGFYTLVQEGMVDASGTLADNLLQLGAIVTAQHKDVLADVLVQCIVAPLVAHVDIEVGNLGMENMAKYADLFEKEKKSPK